jgi:hypothetical protein
MTLDLALLEKLVCPLTRTPLVLGENGDELVSPEAGIAFPIIDGVPILLLEQARILDQTSSP